jgi:phage shock protein PspC (stress-responsive transcriptional regulator)
MKLSGKQERLVARYYEELGARLNGKTPSDRDRLLGQLHRRVTEEMNRFGAVAATDDEVIALLRLSTRAIPELAPLLNGHHEQMDLDLASPEYAGTPRASAGDPRRAQADAPAQGRSRLVQGRTLESTEHRRWLGVCWHLSRRLGVQARYVRLGALILGALTGPFALLAYLGAYFEMYFSSERRMQPSLDPIRLVKALSYAALSAVLMFVGSHLLILGIHAAYQKVFGEEVSAMGGLNWLESNGLGLFLLVMITTAPLAALSALPMADGWNETAGKLYKAVLALYAVGISLGIAAFLVGVMLGFVERYTG